MAASFGIHFGATTASLAVCSDGKATVIANDAGDRTTPAIVAFTDHDRGVGLAAKQGMVRNAGNTVTCVKNALGRDYDEPEVTKNTGKGQAKIANKNGQPVYDVAFKEKRTQFTPVQIASFIYKKMMDTAESHGGIADSHDAVITVPLGFSDRQKNAAIDAATRGGFRVLRVISEPAAAVLAYDIGQNAKENNRSKNVLVYRLGGTSMDITIVEVNNGMYRIVATTADKEHGGSMIEDDVIKHFAGEFKRQWKCDCMENKRSVMKLRNAAENCKHILTTMQSTQCSVESLFEGIDFQSTLSRGRFEALCNSFLNSCLKPMEETLNKASMTREDIQTVILCGGTAKIPSLQKKLQDYFPSAELLTSIPPDEVICVGASKQASILCGLDESILQRNDKEINVPSLASDILVEVSESDQAYVVVLAKNTPIPVKRQQVVQLAATQTSFRLHLLSRHGSTQNGEGAGENGTTEPHSLAKLIMDDLPAGAKVNVVFHVKGDGSLIVNCSEPTSSKTEHITVETS